MPYKSEKQARFLRAVEHDPKFAAKVGVPQSVGREFAVDQRQKVVGALLTRKRPF
jgi:hypothetical protein